MNRLPLYNRTAERASAIVIGRYSTSFRLAARLLAPRVRADVHNIYALVRIADEIADGAADAAGLGPEATARVLNELEAETRLAIERGYSANLVVHAFARTARAAGFGTELTEPFFESMRTDLVRKEHDEASFARYVHGSAEVVGEMCVHVFLREVAVDDAARARLVHGAQRLGAAFQKINFLRDLPADVAALGRSYFPGVDVDAFDEIHKSRILDDVDEDLRVAAAAIRELPGSSRRAVALAAALFAKLARRLRRTPASVLLRSRVRVAGPTKAGLFALALLGRVPKP